jgi:two-component system, NarL family, invasion response regulator UvrY
MKILLADPHPEVQAALHLIVNRIPEVTEVREANNLVHLLAECVQACPDMILFDLDLVYPVRSRSQTLADLINVFHHLCPCSRLVAMSSRFEAEQEALAAGASGFISKTDPPDEVFSDIVRLLRINL